MKKLLVFIMIVTLASCSVDDGDGGNNGGTGKWSLVNIQGGIDGIDNNIETGQITWVFDDVQGILIVENNIGGIPTGISDGNHDYRIETSGNDSFLYIDNLEYGAISIGTRSFTIDQNITTTGTANDKYTMRFVR